MTTARLHPSAQRRARTLCAAVAAAALVAAASCSSDDANDDGAAISTPTSAAPATASSVPATDGETTTAAPTTSAAPGTTAPDTTVQDPSTPGTTPAAPGGAPRQLPPFAAFAGVPLLDGSTSYAGPATPTSLDDVRISDGTAAALAQTPELVAAIEANGFAVDGTWDARFFHSIYEWTAYEYGTLYVTTDAAYHLWHLAFAKVLRDTEREVLAPALQELLVRLTAAARDQADELAGSPFAEHARRVVAYYEAAATLAGADVGPISERAAEEVALATDASKATTSPLTGFEPCQLPDAFTGCVDYTQFLPRGHYTTSEELQRYFRAMALLGQEALYLGDDDSLRMGLLATRPLATDPSLAAAWTAIYEPTAFLVGVADDDTPVELGIAVESVQPGALATTDDLTTLLADSSALRAIADELAATRPVGIDPENASVRVMGARLVLDSFVLDQLAWPNVGTEDDRRVHVSALDLASAFGSPLATAVQTDSGQREYLDYPEQLAAMQELIAGRAPADWAGTVYDAWLYAIEPQFTARTAAYPDYMRTGAWEAKALQTGISSYTELKHDTLLYSKQGSAGEGEGPMPPAYVPQHTVEPDPVSFARLAAVTALCRDGLAGRALLPEASRELLDEVEELMRWLAGIAEDELEGTLPAGADLERLGVIGSEMELLWFESSDLPDDVGVVPDQDDSAALVADIFRTSFEYLELGTGGIQPIYVIVPDATGHFQLATGAVFSSYEFWRPASELRLTDPEWRALLAAGEQPPRPAWQSAFLVGGNVSAEPRVVQDVS